MAEALKILGQSAPSATTETVVYTVPSGREAVISKIVFCNRGASAASVRLSFTINAGTTTSKDYVLYDVNVAANSAYEWPQSGNGITLAQTWDVRVYISTANVSVSVFGLEVY